MATDSFWGGAGVMNSFLVAGIYYRIHEQLPTPIRIEKPVVL